MVVTFWKLNCDLNTLLKTKSEFSLIIIIIIRKVQCQPCWERESHRWGTQMGNGGMCSAYPLFWSADEPSSFLPCIPLHFLLPFCVLDFDRRIRRRRRRSDLIHFSEIQQGKIKTQDYIAILYVALGKLSWGVNESVEGFELCGKLNYDLTRYF